MTLGVYSNQTCGNGSKESFEECDPADKTHNGWGDKGCSESCVALHGLTCDKVTESKLRHGYTYSFSFKALNKKSVPIKVKNVNVNFQERKNFNGESTTPFFRFESWFEKSNRILRENVKNVKVLKSVKNNYGIVYHPHQRRTNFDDIEINYTLKSTKLMNGKEKGYFLHTTCDKYKITWCGDGVRDNYTERSGRHIFEECDDGNKNSGDGCSSTCTLEK